MFTQKQPCVYILASKRNGTLYVGVTANLPQRIHQHQTQAVDGFTKRYHVHLLVYYEQYEDMYTAIAREKQIKTWSRRKKLDLIESKNLEWCDLSAEI